MSTRLRSWRSATDSVVRSKASARRISVNIAIARRDDRSLAAIQSTALRRRTSASSARFGQGAQQVVAQRRAGLGLPAVGARQRPDARPTATQIERRRTSPSTPRAACGRSSVLAVRRARSRRRRCASAATAPIAGRKLVREHPPRAAPPRWRTSGRASRPSRCASSVVDELADARFGTRPRRRRCRAGGRRWRSSHSAPARPCGAPRGTARAACRA